MALDESERTTRVGFLCATVAALGVLFFAYKVGACKDKPVEPQVCQEEFFEMKGDNAIKHTCSPGAIVETVSSPPAPRPGIMCHCPKNQPKAETDKPSP
jgi:hypothetical protein